MAFNPSGTNYAGFQASRDRAREGTTRALKAQGERERQARIKESGKRSPFQKLISAGLRGAAAYYTGGLSETMGGGQMIDSAMLGTDSEGRAVRNEYGDLVGAGASVYQAGKSMQDAKLAKQDARFDKLRSRRMENVQMLFDAGMPKEAMAAQREIENMEGDYMGKRKGMEGANPFQYSDEDYSSLQPQQMSREDRATARMRQHGKWDYEMGEGGQSTADLKKQYGQYGAGQQQQTGGGTSLPPPAGAVQGPNIAEMVDRQARAKKKRDEEREGDREKLAQEKFSPQSEAEAKRGSGVFVPPEARMDVRY